jgi:hypothetical protein
MASTMGMVSRRIPDFGHLSVPPAASIIGIDRARVFGGAGSPMDTATVMGTVSLSAAAPALRPPSAEEANVI